MKTTTRTKGCPLCGSKLAPSAVDGILLHTQSEICSVKLTDTDGVSIDDRFEIEDGVIYELTFGEEAPQAPQPDAQLVALLAGDDLITIGGDGSPYVSTEWALAEIFQEYGVSRLGGASGDRGWSSISTFQRCPYLWRRKYINGGRTIDPISKMPSSDALEVGSLIHTFLAVVYAKVIDSTYPIEPGRLRDQLLDAMVTPEFVHEAWRVCQAYWAYYRSDDTWTPLAVEYHVVDPKTSQSCRIDVVMWHECDEPGLPAGLWLWDHKSASRFDYATLNGWKNDGEIIGLVDLYERLRMHKRFGPLQGVCINLLGKQQNPLFQRTYVFPSKRLIRDHRKSLQVWSSMIDLAKATDHFPRARAACITRYGGLCDHYDHCAQEDEARDAETLDSTR